MWIQQRRGRDDRVARGGGLLGGWRAIVHLDIPVQGNRLKGEFGQYRDILVEEGEKRRVRLQKVDAETVSIHRFMRVDCPVAWHIYPLLIR